MWLLSPTEFYINPEQTFPLEKKQKRNSPKLVTVRKKRCIICDYGTPTKLQVSLICFGKLERACCPLSDGGVCVPGSLPLSASS